MRAEVFQVPERDLQVLVSEHDDGHWTIAFRPNYGSWGPPITSMTATEREATERA